MFFAPIYSFAFAFFYPTEGSIYPSVDPNKTFAFSYHWIDYVRVVVLVNVLSSFLRLRWNSSVFIDLNTNNNPVTFSTETQNAALSPGSVSLEESMNTPLVSKWEHYLKVLWSGREQNQLKP